MEMIVNSKYWLFFHFQKKKKGYLLLSKTQLLDWQRECVENTLPAKSPLLKSAEQQIYCQRYNIFVFNADYSFFLYFL